MAKSKPNAESKPTNRLTIRDVNSKLDEVRFLLALFAICQFILNLILMLKP